MIRALMVAEQAQIGDEILVAGLLYRVVDVEHLEVGTVKILALRIDDTGSVILRLHPGVQFEVIPRQEAVRL